MNRVDIDILINSLLDKFWKIRKDAVWSLGEIGDVAAVEPLIKCLKDGNRRVRQNTASTLGHLSENYENSKHNHRVLIK
jgi:HEAT repeat protein